MMVFIIIYLEGCGESGNELPGSVNYGGFLD